MSIRIRLNLILQKLAAGQEVIEVTGHTTGECLKNLESQFPLIKKEIRDEKGRLISCYFLTLNTMCNYTEQLTLPVKDGDEIQIEVVADGG